MGYHSGMGIALRRATCASFAALLTCAASGCGPPAPSADAASSAARRAGTAFLDSYVRADGRVVRWDQGGDTVSEGQAYALVIASALGLHSIVNRVWSWTEQHLVQPNGLPAWRIDAAGQVADAQSAADADVLMAWALLRAGGDDAARLHAAGLRLADAVLRYEVIVTPGGRHLLAAGPWAVRHNVVNVSYWSSAIFDDLAERTGNQQWAKLADDVPPLLADLTHEAGLLPSDWAELRGENLKGTGSPVAVGSSPSDHAQYGLDAQRTVVWSAASCDTDERAYAARWHQMLAPHAAARSMGLSLTGEIVDATTHPVPMVAASAAAEAAGAQRTAEQMLTAAEYALRQQPTFFGAAWVALGHVLMADTGPFAECD